MVQDKIISGGEYKYDCHPGGLGSAFFDAMTDNKDVIGQVCEGTGTKETFGDMFQRAVRTAIHLKKRNFQPGDIVALCSYNHENSSIPFIAATFIGCIPASFDPLISVTDNRMLLQQINPKIIFVAEECVNMIAEALAGIENHRTEIVVYGQSKQHTPFAEFLVANPEEETTFKPTPCKNIKDTCLVVFSSGTTGLPKGICLPHYGIMAQSLRLPMRYKLIAAFTTLYWLSGVTNLIASILTGSGRFVCKKFDTAKVWEWVPTYKIELMMFGTHLLVEAIEKKPANVDISSLKAVFVGGAPVSDTQITQARKALKGVMVFQGYGQTENCGGTIAPNLQKFSDLSEFVNNPASMGKVMQGILAKVVDPNTEELLGPHQHGELRIKSEFLLNGYYKLDASQAFDADGWFKTGDIVYYDEKRFFYYVERMRDMLKYRQYHVIPLMLETVLKKHPAVLHASVIGLPHEVDGDHPMAFVSLREGFANCTADEIRSFHDSQVDDAKRLRGGLRIVKQFPLSPSDKIMKRELKKIAMQI